MLSTLLWGFPTLHFRYTSTVSDKHIFMLNYFIRCRLAIYILGPVISVSKTAIFRFKKREIPFRFRFIIAKIEFDEITIYPKKVFH